MKTITMKKNAVVKAPWLLEDGTVAYQEIEFTIDFYGSKTVSSHDTRIMADGRQFVIGGCGFIPDGFEVTE